MASPFQFRLRTILALTAVTAVYCALIRHYGISLVLTVGWLILVGLAAMTVWSLVYHVAPEPTKYFTIFAVIATISLLLLPIWIARRREESRRIEIHHRLRDIGLDRAHTEEFHPPPSSGER